MIQSAVFDRQQAFVVLSTVVDTENFDRALLYGERDNHAATEPDRAQARPQIVSGDAAK